MNFSELLISWYLKHKRDLPWRNTKDPYFIWLSEIILQQTRVDQGLNYYLRFVNTYPSIGMLAAENEEKIMKLWQGLGYYSRARNLLITAKTIVDIYNSEFPKSYQSLLKLKGIGSYTAAAIASFAFKLPHAVVDGNVNRVLARYFNIDTPINSTEGKRYFENLALELLSPTDPDLHNQAIMELGAMICTPANPQCESCVLRNGCAAFQKGTIDSRPVKLKNKKARVRHMHYIVLEDENNLILRKRNEKDIWQGLFDFPSIEEIPDADPLKMRELITHLFPDILTEKLPAFPARVYTHQLTHQRIEAQFWHFHFSGSVINNSVYLSVPKSEISQMAVPRLVHKYLEDAGFLQVAPN